MRQLLSALMALILSLTGAQTAPVRTDAALTTFSFNHGGMSMDQIFSYAVREQDGRMFADFELYCRYVITFLILIQTIAAVTGFNKKAL